ncbi:outer dynein arm-docking complex subunit 4 [Dunckerocampus dactyliophorus]|uniref:outer dynein arm-docking complex subunit 4 n=1 Tax=Dunckerocampus dactyliophorus TaxID=161453 RepID=UPI00240614A3|nr:outer dynein arm-docking complex subunit 4 [Dunckerocampus dactyliophorus]
MSETSSEFRSQKPKGVFSTLVADGGWLFLKGECEKAVESYTTALTLKPDDKSCFVGRSKCYLKMGQYDKALKDAEASLQEDQTFFEGLYQKAEALYCMGEFEFALVFYHRGRKLRPQIQEFQLGIQKAQEAIENSVSVPAHIIKQKLIHGDASKLQKDEEHTRKPQTSKMEKTSKKYLGEFYEDRKYLENLLKDEDLVKGRTRSGEQLQDVIQSCLTYLDDCAEFWNQQKPRSSAAKDPRLLQNKRVETRPRAPSQPAHFLLKSLEDINADLASGKTKRGLKKARAVLQTVQGWSEKVVPDKDEVLGSLHSCMGNALADLGETEKALEHHQKDLDLAEKWNLPHATSRALENLASIYTTMGSFTQAMQCWEKKIPLVQGGVEKAWLFHEIGRCHLELRGHEEARDFGLRSVAAAEESGDEKWQLNAHVLVAQSEGKLGNFESCVSHYQRALTHAKLQEDAAATVAIQKAIDETKQL